MVGPDVWATEWDRMRYIQTDAGGVQGLGPGAGDAHGGEGAGGADYVVR